MIAKEKWERMLVFGDKTLTLRMGGLRMARVSAAGQHARAGATYENRE